MPLGIHKAPTNSKKSKVQKWDVAVVIKYIQGEAIAARESTDPDNEYVIAYARGKKAKNKGETPPARVKNGKIRWDHPCSFSCSLSQKKDGSFDKKLLKLGLRWVEKEGKKPKLVGTEIYMDLAKHVLKSSVNKKEFAFSIPLDKDKDAKLHLLIKSTAKDGDSMSDTDDQTTLGSDTSESDSTTDNDSPVHKSKHSLRDKLHVHRRTHSQDTAGGVPSAPQHPSTTLDPNSSQQHHGRGVSRLATAFRSSSRSSTSSASSSSIDDMLTPRKEPTAPKAHQQPSASRSTVARTATTPVSSTRWDDRQHVSNSHPQQQHNNTPSPYSTHSQKAVTASVSSSSVSSSSGLGLLPVDSTRGSTAKQQGAEKMQQLITLKQKLAEAEHELQLTNETLVKEQHRRQSLEQSLHNSQQSPAKHQRAMQQYKMDSERRLQEMEDLLHQKEKELEQERSSSKQIRGVDPSMLQQLQAEQKKLVQELQFEREKNEKIQAELSYTRGKGIPPTDDWGSSNGQQPPQFDRRALLQQQRGGHGRSPQQIGYGGGGYHDPNNEYFYDDNGDDYPKACSPECMLM